MLVLAIVVAVIVLVMVGVVAAGGGGELRGFAPDYPPLNLPEDRAMSADDLHNVTFPVVFRGYRKEDVDELTTRLAAEIDERDAELERLREALKRYEHVRDEPEVTWPSSS